MDRAFNGPYLRRTPANLDFGAPPARRFLANYLRIGDVHQPASD